MSGQHYWQGEILIDEVAFARLATLDDRVQQALAEPLSPLTVIGACDRLGVLLADKDEPVRGRLLDRLFAAGLADDEANALLTELADALGREALERKLVRELGDVLPNRLVRFDFRAEIFEAWAPLGLIAHVAPGNAPAAGALSVVEGLLAGNVNIVKTSGGDALFTQELLAALAEQDPTGVLAQRLIVLNFSSVQPDWLAMMCAPADAVAAWGGEDALAGIRAVLRPGARLVDWGPKLSFAYLTTAASTDPAILHAVARDVCLLDQQACSSPQVVYLDTEDTDEVFAFAERFARVLGNTCEDLAPAEPSQQEWAEITTTALVAQLEEHLDLTKVHTAPNGSWRVIADTRSALRASPLYRTVWVKPLPRKDIMATLRPMRQYLQTAGLGADRAQTAVLSRALLDAGVQRVTMPGAMLASYHGEPHDGVYALQRYSRRVDVQLDDRFSTDACLDDLIGASILPPPPVAVTGKADFESLQQDVGRAEVFFSSGGSSGAPKLSMFTWDDYHEHMRAGAEGLLAAGFAARTDRAMNLFFAGRLYGGFTSIFSALETLQAVQYPMAAQDDHAAIAAAIAANRVNTLLGMPNYLLRVFTEGAEVLRGYRGVRKIFYGGEHFPLRQREWLAAEFGVELIRSAAYGSVDAGPLGYQCQHAADRVHHLFTGVQTLEILGLDEDRPAEPGETGRLVFSSHTRRGQRLDRYEIGDLGRWVAGDCACGRRTPRFELLGRFGDIFRSGTYFFNYRRFVTIAQDAADYAGELQILLAEDSDGELVTARVEPGRGVTEEAFLAAYPELRSAVEEQLVHFAVRTSGPAGFDRTPGSGKLLAVVDRRTGTLPSTVTSMSKGLIRD